MHATAGTYRHSRRRGERRERSAFTLLEMLVTLTIGSLLVLSVVSATRALSTSRESVERRLERSQAAQRALETIVAALRNVRRDPIREEPVVVGTSGGVGEGKDRIDLLVISGRRCRGDGAESDQYEMSFYTTQRNTPDARPVLVCRTDHALDEFPDDGGLVTVVAEGIVSLSFQYMSGGKWLDEWSVGEQRPPEAVRVTVAASDLQPSLSRGLPDVAVLSTVVPIHVDQKATARPGTSADRMPEGGRR